MTYTHTHTHTTHTHCSAHTVHTRCLWVSLLRMCHTCGAWAGGRKSCVCVRVCVYTDRLIDLLSALEDFQVNSRTAMGDTVLVSAQDVSTSTAGGSNGARQQTQQRVPFSTPGPAQGLYSLTCFHMQAFTRVPATWLLTCTRDALG